MPSAPTKPLPGEVWFADLGLAEKSRPILVLTVPGENDSRALVVVCQCPGTVRGKENRKSRDFDRRGRELRLRSALPGRFNLQPVFLAQTR
jgi:mRNA-degrading endonuclease toxin of MazEF toxin-antitoxin module